MKTALVLGAGGFIGSHMVKRLKKEGYWVRGVDLKYPEFSKTEADEFIIGDLRISSVVAKVMFLKRPFDYVMQYAADMGGASYIFSGEHDADVMHNSALINLHVVEWAATYGVGKMLYSSSACIYPMEIQETTNNPGLKESDAYPVHPDSEYGYEKIFSERVYDSFRRNYETNIRVVRFHNIFGEEGTIDWLKAKAPAAICRKVCECKDGGEIEVFGDGLQTRSFLYISEAIDACMRIMECDYYHPLNVGSDEMIAINDLAKMVIGISGKKITIKNIETNVQGVRGRNSNNELIYRTLLWRPTQPLRVGMEKLYHWVNKEING